jgi:hypothetical protein
MSAPRRFPFRIQAAAAALLLAAACSRQIPPARPEITLVQHPTNPAASYVAVKGIGSRTARALKRLQPGADEWSRVFTLRVVGPDNAASATPIAGTYLVEGDAVHFTPLFPLDAGRKYQAALRRRRGFVGRGRSRRGSDRGTTAGSLGRTSARDRDFPELG